MGSYPAYRRLIVHGAAKGGEGRRVLEVVRGWVAKAEADLENAAIVLREGPEGPMDRVAFHAEQCAEEDLMALLCVGGDEVPRIHDVGALLARAALWDRLEMTVEESRLLTDYATVTRYPSAYEPVSHAEPAEAVELAQRIRRALREGLPKVVTGPG